MKLFLRTFIFTYISFNASQLFTKTYIAFDTKSFWMIIIALTLLNIFKRSLLEVVSLPSRGVLFQFISIILTALLLNILVAIIPDFRFLATNTPGFIILGYVIPSTYLSAFWSGIVTAALVSVVSNFFYWLTSKK